LIVVGNNGLAKEFAQGAEVSVTNNPLSPLRSFWEKTRGCPYPNMSRNIFSYSQKRCYGEHMEYPFENKLYELDIKVVEDDGNESDVFSDLDDISTTGTMTSSPLELAKTVC
jgi:hypothetical protein